MPLQQKTQAEEMDLFKKKGHVEAGEALNFTACGTWQSVWDEHFLLTVSSFSKT